MSKKKKKQIQQLQFFTAKVRSDLRHLRGQGYDGSGSMAGKCKGAAAIIQRDYPKAMYIVLHAKAAAAAAAAPLYHHTALEAMRCDEWSGIYIAFG